MLEMMGIGIEKAVACRWGGKITEDEMMLIKDGHQIFLLRWVNALRPYYGGDVIAKVAMRYE